MHASVISRAWKLREPVQRLKMPATPQPYERRCGCKPWSCCCAAAVRTPVTDWTGGRWLLPCAQRIDGPASPRGTPPAFDLRRCADCTALWLCASSPSSARLLSCSLHFVLDPTPTGLCPPRSGVSTADGPAPRHLHQVAHGHRVTAARRSPYFGVGLAERRLLALRKEVLGRASPRVSVSSTLSRSGDYRPCRSVRSRA